MTRQENIYEDYFRICCNSQLIFEKNFFFNQTPHVCPTEIDLIVFDEFIF